MNTAVRLKENRASLCGMCALVFLIACDSGQSPSRLAAAEQEAAKLRSDVCGPANVRATGLRGEYFAAQNWGGALLHTRQDLGIDFPNSFDLPALDAASTRPPGSVRWTGWIKPFISGPYRFHLDGHESAKISVAMQNVLSAETAKDTVLNLSAGRYYLITIELPHLNDAHVGILLEWTLPHGIRGAVPRASLFEPTETVQTAQPTR
jgi:hypothetical protein